MSFDLTFAWTGILAVAVFLYVLLDGFDLGVGILFGFAPDTAARNLAMGSIAPVWDGNETWLVLGGIGLLAAFPLAYAIIIPALYLPIAVMLLALVFRGVAFEFRFRDSDNKTVWDHAFQWGSIIATFSQGIVLGAFIQGFKVTGRQFSGGVLDCFTPFSFLTGLALVAGYGLLGSCWLILKTEGEQERAARRHGLVCLAGVLTAIAAVSIWTPLAEARIAHRWFAGLHLLWFSPAPIACAGFALWCFTALKSAGSWQPFVATVGLFATAYLGIAISLWPYVVPPVYTLSQAAADPATQAFLLTGTVVLLPVILGYTAWSYWVFRGKVQAGFGYH